ncbi:MAG: Rrf2 family transcriptional regulator [Flavobacteriaceae bacterium]|nr:Rrf2 family transcriptional regulator [Flavobacteriaceae bacterium]
MFSNSSKYAIKAVLYLALNSSKEKKIMVKDIAEPINVPQAYIAKLLQELSRQNLISSTKGPRGGFYLSETDKQIPLRKIIHVIDGESRLSSCLLSLEDCNEDKPCPLHKSMYPLKTKLLESLENKTIVDLAKDVEEGNSFLPL